MTTNTPESAPFGPAMHVWFDLWRAQVDQSLKLWTWWAQYVPHESAAELSAEAEAMKTESEVAAPAVRSRRSVPAR